MKRWLIPMFAVVFLAGCAPQSLRKGRVGLELLYIAKVPTDDAGFSALSYLVKSIDKPLVVIDDPAFSPIPDLAWWEGQKELFLLDTLGAGLFFPPSSWMLLGPDKLKELSAEADFFIPAANLVDDSSRYILPRYMIRRQGSYRLAFSAAVGPSSQFPALEGENLLPVDSLLPVTASYLGMQSDFFFFFDGGAIDDLPPFTSIIQRGQSSRQLSFNFLNTREFRMSQKPLKPAASTGAGLYALWQQKADSMDSEIIGSSASGIGMDSLRHLVIRALGAGESTMVYLGEGVIKDSLPAGEITFGEIRKALAAEIFLGVSRDDFIGAMGENMEGSAKDVKEVIIPSSLFIANTAFNGVEARPTGLTSAWLARKIFAKEEK